MIDFSQDAFLHRSNLISKMTEHSGIIYLKGGNLNARQWTDVEYPFRQESYFYYLTGFEEPGAHLIIDISSSKSIMFVPRYDADHSLWCGSSMAIDEISLKYGIQVAHVDQMETTLKEYKVSKYVHVLFIDQIDKNVIFNQNDWIIDDKILKDCLDECRVFKTSGEIGLMKIAAGISANGHLSLMKNLKTLDNEQQGAALFQYECAKEGAMFQAYTPIVAVGKNGSVLHYTKNNDSILKSSSGMLLVDAGCEFSCYASDITRVYPIKGRFDNESREIYEIVLQSQEAVLEAMKPGVEWEDMHRLAAKIILDGLIRIGIVQGDYQELTRNHISAIFFPHGLGHLIGIDVHDVGGYPKGVERIMEPGIRYLRMRRTLQENMVVTVEPGLYFIDQILNQALDDTNIAKFINTGVLDKYRHLGGVRIEDDVLIIRDGVEILTSQIPKKVQDIERFMLL